MTASLAEPSDEILLQRMIAGDEQAFTLLYRRHQPGISRFALHMSGSADIAEEVTQEVFLALIRQPRQYAPERGPLASYLYGIARKQVLRRLAGSRLQATPRDGEEPTVAWGVEDDFSRRQQIERVRRAILALPPRYREVVVLVELNEMSYQEAAEVAGCTIGTVRSRLSRAKSLLESKLINVEKCST